MTRLIVIAGMPGSGKTQFIKNHYLGFPDHHIFDNYMKDSGVPIISKSKHQNNLLEFLKKGDDCIVTDIQFIERKKRNDLRDIIYKNAPDVTSQVA